MPVPSRNADVGLVRIGRDVETELPAHFEHCSAFAQHLPLDELETFGAGVFDDQLHEQVTETASFQVETDQNGLFAALVVGIRVQTAAVKRSYVKAGGSWIARESHGR